MCRNALTTKVYQILQKKKKKKKVRTQRTQQNTETSQDSGPANANIDMNTKTKKYSVMLQSKLILEHHLAFANECVQNSIYPLGLKAFVLCVAYKADDALKRKWKQILHNTSMALALRRSHFNTLLEKTSGQLSGLEKQIEDGRDEEIICAWEEEKASLEVEIMKKEKEMKEVRSKKIKHAMKIHKGGRLFGESCLRENGSAGLTIRQSRQLPTGPAPLGAPQPWAAKKNNTCKIRGAGPESLQA